MNATHSQNRTLERIAKVLEFIEAKYRSNPEKETFLLSHGALSNFDPLLHEGTLLKMAIEKITSETENNIRIENRLGLPEQHGTSKEVTHELLVWIYVEDQNKFKDYQGSVKSKIERKTKAVQFVLDSQGFFYPEGTEPENRYQLKRGSDRYQLLYLLAKENGYIATKELAEKLKNIPTLVVRKRVGEIRNIIVKKWALPREALFESDNTSGYRVTNVTLKES